MRIRPLRELAAVDELVQRFTPDGFGLDRILTPESTVEFHQQTIADADLIDEVPDDVRAAFEEVRECHTYGTFSYRLFSLAAKTSLLVSEGALRRRFLEFYNGRIPLENKAGQVKTITVRTFEDLNEDFRRGGVLRKQGWRLKLVSSGQTLRMPLTLDPLLRWARLENLLDGQASRIQERLIPTSRNWVAHGEMSGADMPNWSTRRINDLAEFINRLWGARTPGGRLYPAPLARCVAALASSTSEGRLSRAVMAPDQIPAYRAQEGEDTVFLLVRAVPDDDKLLDFNSVYERTTYPADLLWGPGDGEVAYAWWKEHQPVCAPADPLDRLFMIQVIDDKVYLPRRVEVAFGLPPDKRPGVWYAVRADEPGAAFLHVRNVTAGACEFMDSTRCSCAAEGVTSGSWWEVKAALDPFGVFALVEGQVGLPLQFPLPPTVGHD